MKLVRNLFAGLTNSAWTAIVTFATVPIYLKFVGIEAYGLIGFFATTQALLQLLDLGLAPTINREIARHSASGDTIGAATTLHTLAIIYWLMAALLALLFLIGASTISEHWLGENTLPTKTTANAILLTGLVIACRWPLGLYRGALLGAQRLATASVINIIMVTLSSIGAVAILAFVSATIEAFFLWQLAISLLHVFVLRHATWKVIGHRTLAKFSVSTLKRIWLFSAGMAGVAATGIILAQLDKVLLSNLLGLEAFAHYTLAFMVASGLYILLTPTFSVIYPKLSVFVSEKNIAELEKMYHSGTKILCAVLFPVAITAAFFSHDLVYAWTGNAELAHAVKPIVQIAILGTALNGAMHFPYALQLAFGASHLPLLINIVLIAIFIPLIFLFVEQFGALGGAMAWLCVNAIYLVLGSWITHRSFLKNSGVSWLLRDVAAPLLISSAIILPGGAFVLSLNYGTYINLLCAAGLAGVACTVIAMLMLRDEFEEYKNGARTGLANT